MQAIFSTQNVSATIRLLNKGSCNSFLLLCLAVLFVSFTFKLHAANSAVETEQTLYKQQTELTLLYDKPGSDWESESLPIGNGALGATVLGGVKNDVVQFSEKTLWTGGPSSIEGYDFGIPLISEQFPQKVDKVQRQLKVSQSLSPEKVVKDLGREVIGYGSYQSFADINLLFDHDLSQVTHYKRSLDLNSAIAKVEYQYKGVKFLREYFVSYPDQVIVIKLSTSGDNKLNFLVDLTVPKNRSLEKSSTLSKLSKGKSNSEISISGRLVDNNLAYEAQLNLLVEQGVVNKTTNNQLRIKSANSVVLTVSAATNYQQSYPLYRGQMPHQKVNQTIKEAQKFTYKELKQRHLFDYQALFSRVSLDLNHKLPNIPTSDLLAQFKLGMNTPEADRALLRLYYQLGRYLLISSSRAGSLPANLQGVWNKYELAPWSSDYHVNINLQMNYWLANMTNLPETNLPLFDFIDSLIEPGEISAKRIFDADGWVMFLNTNVWGFTGPIAWPTAFWQPEGAAWMSLHYYQHYLFNQNDDFLKQRAYPVLKKTTEFWLSTLVFDPSISRFVVTPSFSPEHGDFSSGAAMSQQIVAELFRSTQSAAEIVGDQAMVSRISHFMDNLELGLSIGSWGQLQEWQQDLDERSTKHRHISHLFALHPGNMISPIKTPELAQAASVSLNARGDAGTGWSKAWKINFWARLFDGNRAYKLLSEQLKHSTLSNLWDNHPPFQIDGNFGATAGITEMLLQSQNHEIHLLPALPLAWPSGKVIGLKARGNTIVDISWQKGELTEVKLLPKSSHKLTIRSASFSESSRVFNNDGKLIPSVYLQSVISFEADKNHNYTIKL